MTSMKFRLSAFHGNTLNVSKKCKIPHPQARGLRESVHVLLRFREAVRTVDALELAQDRVDHLDLRNWQN